LILAVTTTRFEVGHVLDIYHYSLQQEYHPICFLGFFFIFLYGRTSCQHFLYIISDNFIPEIL